jgi:hypothetical protein
MGDGCDCEKAVVGGGSVAVGRWSGGKRSIRAEVEVCSKGGRGVDGPRSSRSRTICGSKRQIRRARVPTDKTTSASPAHRCLDRPSPIWIFSLPCADLTHLSFSPPFSKM